MARPPQIRITKNDREEYSRLARNAKAKIKRTTKNYGVDLTGVVKIPDLESFSSRREFNEWKRSVKSFTSRSNLKYQYKKNDWNVVASVKEIREAVRNTKIAQRVAKKLSKEAAKKPFVSGGKTQGTVGQRMMQMGKPNTAGITIPGDFVFDNIRARGQFEKKAQNMKERSDPKFFNKRMEAMKKNYIMEVQQTFNSDADKLVEMLRALPADDFYEMYLMFDEMDFDYFYTLDDEDMQHFGQLNLLMSYVDRYNRGKVNMDLKGF